MAAVMMMEEIKEKANRLEIDPSSIDLDSIHLPPGEDCGIVSDDEDVYQEIAKSLKKYSKKYEAEDQDVSLLLSEQEREKRRMLKEDWDKWVSEWKRMHEEEKLQREELRDGEASDEEEEYEAKDIEVEEVIDVSEEVLHFE
uniref:Uncharacterized protein n=1 Tax=Lotus japonicus TaxID=34305 RepID=I3SBF5_LOTJA|nr:unknown [Lotus japonicus]